MCVSNFFLQSYKAVFSKFFQNLRIFEINGITDTKKLCEIMGNAVAVETLEYLLLNCVTP